MPVTRVPVEDVEAAVEALGNVTVTAMTMVGPGCVLVAYDRKSGRPPKGPETR